MSQFKVVGTNLLRSPLHLPRRVARLSSADWPTRDFDKETTPRAPTAKAGFADTLRRGLAAAVVADGHGGQAAARHVAESFFCFPLRSSDRSGAAAKNSGRDITLPETAAQTRSSDARLELSADAVALRRAWDAAAAEFFDWANVGEGAVVVSAVVDPDSRRAAVLHCGDARCVVADLRSGRWPVAFETTDHALRDPAERAAFFTRGGRLDDTGRVIAGDWRVAVPRALGGRAWRDAGVVPVADVMSLDTLLFDDDADSSDSAGPVPARWCLILASDGLWDAFSSLEAALYVRARRLFRPAEDAATIADHLAARAAALGSEDDVSVALVFVE